MKFKRELELARELSLQAGCLALEYFHRGVVSEDKPDDSPVTIADREAERFVVAGLDRTFPEDGLLGEEGAERTAANGRRWIIDPVDGTRDFVRGNRLWSSFLALEVDGVVQLGVCTFPALDEQYFALRGAGAFRVYRGEERQIQVSKIDRLERAVACVNGMNGPMRRWGDAQVLDFLSRFWAVRSMGGALDAMLVCSGSAEFWIENSAKPWDLAPLQVIAQEAGARFFDHQGLDTIYGGSALICAPPFEPAAREFLGIA
jgi:fructose-1,6-bisphosphatase/inositol monophosphatase family enzyme